MPNSSPSGRWLPSLALLAMACSDAGVAAPNLTEGSKPDSDPGTPDNPRATSLEVRPQSLDISPGQTEELLIRLVPKGVYPVRASLIGPDVGAFLDSSELTTNGDGKVSVKLTMATESQDFSVRLSVGSLATEIPVTARSRVVADVLAIPRYDGRRPVNAWHVTVGESADCADYDAYTQSSTLSFGLKEPLQLKEVFAGRPQTILVRGEDYVFGCREDVTLDPTQPNRLEVPVADKPLQLTDLSVPLMLGVNQSPELQSELNAQIEAMVAAFNGGQADSSALLEGMALAAEDENGLRQRIDDEDWAAALTAQLGAEGAADGLSRVVRSWLFAGSQRLYTEDTMKGELKATASTLGKATYILESVAGVDPVEAGAPTHYLTTLGADADDRLRIGLESYFLPSRLLGAVSAAVALESHNAEPPAGDGSGPTEEADSAPALLALTLDCETLGQALEAVSEPTRLAESGSTCGADCLSALCAEALANMWSAATASSLGAARLELSANAGAKTDTFARVLSLTGDWVGNVQLSTSTAALPVRGPLSAGAAPEDSAE